MEGGENKKFWRLYNVWDMIDDWWLNPSKTCINHYSLEIPPQVSYLFCLDSPLWNAFFTLLLWFRSNQSLRKPDPVARIPPVFVRYNLSPRLRSRGHRHQSSRGILWSAIVSLNQIQNLELFSVVSGERSSINIWLRLYLFLFLPFLRP